MTDIRPSKRQRQETKEVSNNIIVIDDESDTETVPKTALPFYLSRLKDAPEHHNKYAIGITDILEGSFTSCLLTNYMFDAPWLLEECPRLKEVPCIFVHGERDSHVIKSECQQYPNLTLVSPHLPIPYGTHHTKMMVIIYPTKVRVAIFTANFISIDWNNKTQGIWYQDFFISKLANPQIDLNDFDFEQDLIAYLSTLGKKVETFCNQLKKFDFSTAKVALIPSVPGVHKGNKMHRYGHLRVKKLLKHFKVPETNHPLICQFSSMGSLDEKWLFGEFAQSFMPGCCLQSKKEIKSFHIIWPSVEDVRNSIEGWNAGRAIPCPLKNMKSFLHKYLRKWTPPAAINRQNAMPHIKTYARFNPTVSGELDWAILTSSNLSKAAWGTYQKNETQFMIRSYELGVLFLPQLLEGKSSIKKLMTIQSTEILSSPKNFISLPLPYGFPIKTYKPQVDEPWVWDLVRKSPDIYGNCYLPH